MGLSLEALAQIGEFVGGFVVLVSVVYLAIQVRQNTRSQRTENYGRVLDRISDVQSRMSTDPELSEIFSRGCADLSRLNQSERIRFAWALRETFGCYEFMYNQARDGALPAEVWDRWSTTLKWWISFPGIRTWWKKKPTPFSASFTAFVEVALDEVPAQTGGGGPWQGLMDDLTVDGPPSGRAGPPTPGARR